VISVDAKKKEQLGWLPNGGREWRPHGDPVKVVDHSFFTGPQVPQALPYGVYDLTNYPTLKEYPLAVTLVDMCWGAFATAGDHVCRDVAAVDVDARAVERDEQPSGTAACVEHRLS